MNRRELLKSILGVFAGLVCSIPFVKGERPKLTKEFMEMEASEVNYDGDGKLTTTIHWTSVEDKLPEPVSEDVFQFNYLVRNNDGIIFTVRRQVLDFDYCNTRKSGTHYWDDAQLGMSPIFDNEDTLRPSSNWVTHWAHLPKV